MKWIFLIVAGVFEICFAVGLKYTEGFTKLAPSIFTFIGMVGGLYFLSLALKELPLGVAYAIWTGIGTLGAVVFGTIMLKEGLSLIQYGFIGIILLGIIGLKVVSN